MRKLALALIILLISQPTFSNTHFDSDRLFEWAEGEYPQFFQASEQNSISSSDWYYRHYPESSNYLGVNENDLGVYVLGDPFDGLVFVDSLQALLQLIPTDYSYLTGDWTIIQTIGFTTCRLESYAPVSLFATVDVTNNNITLITSLGTEIEGEIQNNRVPYEVTLPPDDGVTLTERGTLIIDGESVTNDAWVTASSRYGSCEIEIHYSGSKIHH